MWNLCYAAALQDHQQPSLKTATMTHITVIELHQVFDSAAIRSFITVWRCYVKIDRGSAGSTDDNGSIDKTQNTLASKRFKELMKACRNILQQV